MTKAAVFTMKLDADLRDDFMAAAEASHRPASQVVRELMREFIRREEDRRDYNEFLRLKVEDARASIAAGEYRDNAEVEAEFAARRARIANRV